MTKRDLQFWGLFLAGVAVVLGYAWFTLRPAPSTPPGQAETAPPVKALAHEGRKLEITIDGQAKGRVIVQLFEDVAPKNAARLAQLASEGAYDGVVFHRVIDGFMAQTGDVKYGRAGGDLSRAGMGGSEYENLPLEASEISFERGIVGMARASDPNSANSQFFIMFAPARHLNGQYTVVGQVIEGMDVVDAIKRGTGANGAIEGPPDRMVSVRVLP